MGTQYRSAIFYHSDEQKKTAEKSKADMDASGRFKDPIVTEITQIENYSMTRSYTFTYPRER